MKTRSLYPILLAFFAFGSVVSQNAEELPVHVETDNQFPPEHSELDGHNEGNETTVTEPTLQTSGPTTAASTLTNEDAGNESTVEESAATTADSSVIDEPFSTLTNNDKKVTDNADVESTAAEPTQTTSGYTMSDVPVPTLKADEKQMNNEGSETKAVDLSTTVASTLKTEDDQVTYNGASETTVAESTQITSETLIADVATPTLITEVEQDTTKEGSEITAAEPIELTSGTTIGEVAATTVLTFINEQEVTNEGSENTVVEFSEPTLGSTIAADVVSPTLTTENDQDTNKEVGELLVVQPTSASELPTCPKPCVCITEGDSSNYIVDCSGLGLTELPTPIDPKTSTLKLQDNKLTVIPKVISELKNLKVLNINYNLITELESGSVSELPELVSLKLANNRLLEYPKDLELTLNKLEELDLAGNELKTTPEMFLNYKALRTVTLPEVSPELVSELCTSLKETLVTVCAKSCENHSFKCSDEAVIFKDDATLPGVIPFIPELLDEVTDKSHDITSKSGEHETDNTSSVSKAPETSPSSGTKETPDFIPVPEILSDEKDSSQISPEPELPETSPGSTNNLPVTDFSLRVAVNNALQEKVALHNIVIDTPEESTYNETDVKVGAKTTDTKGGGGVDKSVIAVVVAGMVIIIAVIAVKKNWSSIRKKFSSTPRPNEQSGTNTNGTTPEEVPLQDKSPV